MEEKVNNEKSEDGFLAPYEADNQLSKFIQPVAAAFSGDFDKIVSDFRLSEKTFELPIVLGMGENSQFKDLYHFPNLLLAGTTGSGKTQFLYNQLVLWMFVKHPSELKVIVCGTKSIDYNLFSTLSAHYLASVAGMPEIVAVDTFELTLQGLQMELDARLLLFAMAGVKNKKDYNILFATGKLGYSQEHRFLPDVAMLIDDLFNFVRSEEISTRLVKILQQSNYTGIYILAVTSQISSPIISRQLKSNFVFRIGMRLMSQADSKRILDTAGAEKLIAAGELLYLDNGKLSKGLQPMIEFGAVREVVDFVGCQRGYPNRYELEHPNPPMDFDPYDLDPLFVEAAQITVMHQQGSSSLVQRKLKLGYNRAMRIVDQLEMAGVVGPFEGSKAREVLIPDQHALEQFINSIKGLSKSIDWARFSDEVNKKAIKDTAQLVEAPASKDEPKQEKKADHSSGLWTSLKNMFNKPK